MRLGALVIPAFLAASLLGAAGSAWADEGSQTSAVEAAFAPGAPALVWPLLVLVVTAAPALRRRRSLRLAAAALVLVLLGFAFQSALHSAHHGPDHAASAACATASLAAHADASPAQPVAVETQALLAATLFREQGPLAPTDRPLGARLGRAPPSARV